MEKLNGCQLIRQVAHEASFYANGFRAVRPDITLCSEEEKGTDLFSKLHLADPEQVISLD